MPGFQKQHKLTLNDVAAMVQRGFGEAKTSVKEQFSEVNKKIDLIEGKIGDIENSMATKTDIKRLEDRFISVEKRVYDDHHPRLRKIEKKLQMV